MAEEYLAIIGTIIGAFIGFIGTIFGFWLKDRSSKRNKENHIKAVRDLIKLEICHNSHMLQRIWSWVNEPDPNDNLDIVTKEEHSEYKTINLANRFMQLQLPSLSNYIWKSQLHIVPIAFNTEEIGRMHRFYSNMQYIPTIHSSLENNISNKDYEDIIANWKQLEGIIYLLTEKTPKINVNNNTKCPPIPKDSIQESEIPKADN